MLRLSGTNFPEFLLNRSIPTVSCLFTVPTVCQIESELYLNFPSTKNSCEMFVKQKSAGPKTTSTVSDFKPDTIFQVPSIQINSS